MPKRQIFLYINLISKRSSKTRAYPLVHILLCTSSHSYPLVTYPLMHLPCISSRVYLGLYIHSCICILSSIKRSFLSCSACRLPYLEPCRMLQYRKALRSAFGEKTCLEADDAEQRPHANQQGAEREPAMPEDGRNPQICVDSSLWRTSPECNHRWKRGFEPVSEARHAGSDDAGQKNWECFSVLWGTRALLGEVDVTLRCLRPSKRSSAQAVHFSVCASQRWRSLGFPALSFALSTCSDSAPKVFQSNASARTGGHRRPSVFPAITIASVQGSNLELSICLQAVCVPLPQFTESTFGWRQRCAQMLRHMGKQLRLSQTCHVPVCSAAFLRRKCHRGVCH